MLDMSLFQEVFPGPRVLFESVQKYGPATPRFFVPDGAGDWDVVTWGAFEQRVEDLGLFLAHHGLKAGTQGAILSTNSIDWLAAGMAIQATGAALVPIYPSTTPEGCVYIVEHSDAEIVFVEPALLGKLLHAVPHAPKLRRIVLMGDVADAAQGIAAARAAGVDVRGATLHDMLTPIDIAAAQGRAVAAEAPDAYRTMLHAIDVHAPGAIIYTSGTTGRPKGVVLTHYNVGISAKDWLTNNQSIIAEGWTDTLWLPFSHVYGWGEFGLGNALGFQTYMSDPKSVMAELPVVRPHVFMSVPAYWEKLYLAAIAAGEDKATQIAHLKAITGGRLSFCLSGGAGLKREVKEFFYEAGLLIIEGYGLTEASPTLTMNRPDDFDFSSVGKPFPSVELKLAEDGEILAKGPNVFGGYYKNPEATKDTFTADGWLLTGDVGRINERGFLQIVDRKKDILVTAGGKNVPPANIEIKFADDPYIAHCAVYGDGKKYLTALLVPEYDALNAWAAKRGIDTNDRDALLAHPDVQALIADSVAKANAQLARFETIKKWVVHPRPFTVEEGFLTASLKLRRRQVFAALGDAMEALY